MYFVHTSDGVVADSGLSETKRGEGWVACDYDPPSHADDEFCICTGFVKDGDSFRAVFKVTKVEVEPMKYSTLSIKRELAKLGKWEAAKALIERSGAWDDYILANYLAENDPVFVAAKAAFVAAGILTADELAELLPKCVWTAE